ncbi:hypothetical protein [Pseudomonas sp. NCCP-436]|uniref:hypothetical protein n=1 Tax=Pseudomonas sp. NCCP-436 TaxID=2842481 RepID=UPI001C7E9812|nr:hypothetical protein [Pseudomonas sp. NCCP-436]GIZ13643.1 hypothetical protein NCCP436_30590 [Pseudomonas sp. NCCP-436]
MQKESLKVALVKPEQKVWFIRSSAGIHARHFRSASLIAIGHLEDAFEGTIGDKIPSEDEIKKALLSNDKYSHFKKNKDGKETKYLNRKGSQLLGQTKRFVNDIKQGDLVVTKNEDGGYNIGICTDSQAYIEHTPIELVIPEDAKRTARDRIELKHKLRKKVTWGPSVSPNELPGAVRKATRGQHTITDLSPHKEKVFHLIYPFFTDGESLYFSSKIRRQGKIGALVVGNLFQNVSLAENLISQLLSNSIISEELLLQLTERNAFDQESAVTCQAAFMSPGDFWCKVPLLSESDFLGQVYAGVLAFLILTGQAETVQFDPMLIAPSEISATLKHKEDDPDSIFNDKLKEPEASPLLKQIAENAQRNKEVIEKIEKDRHTQEINDNLELGVTDANTSRLESFTFGINIIEFRKKNENN